MTETTNQSNGLATGGLVVGILALLFSIILFWFAPIGFILGIVGLVLSVLGIKKSKTANVGRGSAVAGLVMSIIAVVLTGIILIGIAGAGLAVANEASKNFDPELLEEFDNIDLDKFMEDAK